MIILTNKSLALSAGHVCAASRRFLTDVSVFAHSQMKGPTKSRPQYSHPKKDSPTDLLTYPSRFPKLSPYILSILHHLLFLVNMAFLRSGH